MSDLQKIADFFTGVAEAVRCDPLMVEEKSRSLNRLEEKITKLHTLARLSSEDIILASEQLRFEGISEFSFAGQGSSAICLKDKMNAVRIGPAAIRKWLLTRESQQERVRDRCPLVIQPSFKMHFQRAAVYFEVMPLIKMVGDADIPMSFKRLMPQVVEGTCFEASVVNKDLGVLFDGTPIYVDPGAFRLKDYRVLPSEDDFQRIRENCEALKLPEPLSWVLPDGRFKQEIFHSMKQTDEFDVVV